MFRIAMFLLALAAPGAVSAQIPPGPPYDPATHPNPIITYVATADFKASDFDKANALADIELLGLSRSEAKRTSVEVADAGRQKVKVLGRTVDVTFYPVVQQRFQLAGDGELILHSFKNPKSAVPARILDQAAFLETKKPEDARFGKAPKPEKLEIRGVDALLFENNGHITIFWQEDGVGHTLSGQISRQEIFRLAADLL